MGWFKNRPPPPTQGEVMAQMEKEYKAEVAKDPPLPGPNYYEISEWIIKEEIREERKLFRRAPLWRTEPTYNDYAREHHPVAPAYPEMEKEGYVHKQHGNVIVPDYRVYQPERVRQLMPDGWLAQHMTRLEQEGLKDPWLRNDTWKMDPYCGFQKGQHYWKRKAGWPVAIGVSLAVFHHVAKTIWEKISPPPPHVPDEWWKDRPIPENQEFKNRIKPKKLLHGKTFNRHPECFRNEHNHYIWGMEAKPVKQWYDPAKDPYAVEPNFKNCLLFGK